MKMPIKIKSSKEKMKEYIWWDKNMPFLIFKTDEAEKVGRSHTKQSERQTLS